MDSAQARQNAKNKILAAKSLLENFPDEATYLAGYAVELILKSRMLTLRRWNNFPRGNPEDKKWTKELSLDPNLDKFMQHNLDRLLNQSGLEQIVKDEFSEIHWPSIARWSEKLRYVPPGSMPFIDANRFVLQAEQLVNKLYEFIFLDEVQKILLQSEAGFGPFNLAFLVETKTPNLWGLLFCARAPDHEKAEVRNQFLNLCLRSTIGLDFSQRIRHLKWIGIGNEICTNLRMYTLSGSGAMIHLSDCVGPSMLLPNGILLRRYGWSEPELKAYWALNKPWPDPRYYPYC